MDDKKAIFKILISACLCLLMLPVLYSCFYAIPAADDFTNSLGWQNWEGNYLIYMFDNLSDIYQTWQGTYFGVFIAGFPMYYIFGLPGLRIWLFLVSLLFFVSVLILGKISCQWLEMKKENIQVSTLLLSTLGVFFLLNTNDLSEIFCWYTGTCVYTLPIIFSFLAFSCYLQYELEERNIYVYLGILCGICGAGGALCVSAFLCATLLFGILYNIIIKKRIRWNAFIGIFSLLGSIINTIAPGNFVRHDVIDSEIRIKTSIIDIIFRINNIIATELQQGLLLVVLVVVFLYGYHNLKDSSFEFKYPLLVTLYAYFGIFITDFPTVLGYSSAKLVGRVAFAEGIAVVVFLIGLSLYWSGWATKKKIFNFTKDIYFVIALVLIIPLSSYIDIDKALELTTNKMIRHLASGDYKTISDREKSVIDYIENSEEADVVISLQIGKDANEWTSLKTIGLTEDPDYWVNTGIASYYGKNTIVLQYVE